MIANRADEGSEFVHLFQENLEDVSLGLACRAVRVFAVCFHIFFIVPIAPSHINMPPCNVFSEGCTHNSILFVLSFCTYIDKK